MLKRGPFSERCWFLSELGKHAAKNDLKAPSASAMEMPSLLLTVDPLSFPSCLNGVLETIILSTAEWHNEPDGFVLKGCLQLMHCCPCSVFSPPADVLCAGCLACVPQLCMRSGSLGFSPLETARRPRERGSFTGETFPRLSPFCLPSRFFTRK